MPFLVYSPTDGKVVFPCNICYGLANFKYVVILIFLAHFFFGWAPVRTLVQFHVNIFASVFCDYLVWNVCAPSVCMFVRRKAAFMLAFAFNKAIQYHGDHERYVYYSTKWISSTRQTAVSVSKIKMVTQYLHERLLFFALSHSFTRLNNSTVAFHWVDLQT